MTKRLWRRRAAASSTLALVLATISCGGSSGTTVSSVNSNPPAAGNYVWQSGNRSGLSIATVGADGGLGAPTAVGLPSTDPYPSLGTDPLKHFLFLKDTSATGIRVFSMTGPGIELSENLKSPFYPTQPAGPMNSMSVDPMGRFVYVVESPSKIQEFSIDSSTGNLTDGAVRTETNADLRSIVIMPSGKFLYINDLTGGRIFGYQIGSDGSLIPVPGSPFTLPANGQPTLVSVDGSSRFLYCPLLSGGVAAAAIDATTGAITDVLGSPFPTADSPTGIVTSPSGYVYVSNNSGAVDGFKIGGDGALTPVAGSPYLTAFTAMGPAVDATGQFLYVGIEASNIIYGFRIDSSSGTLSALSASPFPAIAGPTAIVPMKIP